MLLDPGSQKICPFVGIDDDPTTSLAYPSEMNLCHHARPVISPNLTHQHAYCLSSDYPLCPVYKGGGGLPLPPAIGVAGKKISFGDFDRWKLVSLLLGLLMVIFIGLDIAFAKGGFLSRIFSQGNGSSEVVGIQLETVTPSLPVIFTTEPTSTPTPTPTFTPTITTQPSETITQTQTATGTSTASATATATRTQRPSTAVPTRTNTPQDEDPPTATPTPTPTSTDPPPPTDIPSETPTLTEEPTATTG